MDTVRVNHASVRFSRQEKSYSYIGFIGGFVVMLVGLLTGVNWLAALGFVPMVVSFLFLNSMLWSKYYQNTSIKKMLRDRGVNPDWIENQVD